MKNLINTVVKLTFTLVLLSLTACGGGGGGTAPAPPVTQEQAVVSMTLIGGTDTIGAVQFDLVLPAGFSLETDTQGDLVAGVLTVSIAGSTVDTNYSPEDTLNFGQLTLALVNTGGFSASLFATLVHDMASGESLPLATDFTVSNLLVSELLSNGDVVPVAGYTVEFSILQRTVIP